MSKETSMKLPTVEEQSISDIQIEFRVGYATGAKIQDALTQDRATHLAAVLVVLDKLSVYWSGRPPHKKFYVPTEEAIQSITRLYKGE